MDIKKKIWDSYRVDLDKVNLLKLYKITGPEISSDELELLLRTKRREWEQTAHGTNDMLATKAKAHLAKADDYEAILRSYLRPLVDYYSGAVQSGDNGAGVEFARDFFTTLRPANKDISQTDFNFFMEYFREERKKEKAIREMLKKEFRASLKSSGTADETDPDGGTDGENQKGSSVGLTKARFQKETLSLLHKAELQYADLQKSSFLSGKFTGLDRTMSDFLHIDEQDSTSFAAFVDGAAQVTLTERQNDLDNSGAYIPMSNFWNTWKDLMKQEDARGNFLAFRLLARYPKLTPYFYLAENVDERFLESLLRKFKDESYFSGLQDFFFRYFKTMVDGRHFSFLVDSKLEANLKKVEKDPEAADQESKQRSAASKRRRMMPLPLKILRFFATWPIYLLQFLFESFRFVVINVQKLTWVIGVFAVVAYAHLTANTSIFSVILHYITHFLLLCRILSLMLQKPTISARSPSCWAFRWCF